VPWSAWQRQSRLTSLGVPRAFLKAAKPAKTL
jgi:hypothetical protein